jgi:hypothetical protein
MVHYLSSVTDATYLGPDQSDWLVDVGTHDSALGYRWHYSGENDRNMSLCTVTGEASTVRTIIKHCCEIIS